MTMTKENFLAVYREILVHRYAESGWANNAEKLAAFMTNVRKSIETTQSVWHCDSSGGSAAQAAWKRIGGKGRVSYRALRALPSEAATQRMG